MNDSASTEASYLRKKLAQLENANAALKKQLQTGQSNEPSMDSMVEALLWFFQVLPPSSASSRGIRAVGCCC